MTRTKHDIPWRHNKRPGIIPKTLREMLVGDVVTFPYEDNLAPPGKLQERIVHYISKERRRHREEAGIPRVERDLVRGSGKLFARKVVDNVGVSVTRMR